MSMPSSMNTPPSWITKSYLENLISKQSYSNIEQILIESATEEGSNFSSILLRIKVILADGNIKSFIVKTIITQEIANDVLVNGFNVHNKEMFVYGCVIAEYNKLFNITNNESIRLAPYVHNVDRENEAIIFEDLSIKGYIVADRKKGLNINHCELVLEKLAKLHAGSIALHMKDSKIFEPFHDGKFALRFY